MPKLKTAFFQIVYVVIVLFLLILFTLSLLIYPKESFEGALYGINLWINTVLPALLPFFIGSSLMMELGIIKLLGYFLEPIMRPIFNVPGEGAFALAMGLTSGYPVGAKITTDLREKNMCTKVEAERLMSFCNNSGPLFMIGAVGIGIYNNPILGYIILVSNYLGALTTGFFFRYYKRENKRKKIENTKRFSAILRDFYATYKKNRKPIGTILSNAVKDSINSLLMICGFIVLFSVILKILEKIGVMYLISIPISNIMQIFNIHTDLAFSSAKGIFEITLASKSISETVTPLYQKIIITSMIIAWGGLSIHAQVLSIISKTDIRITPYIIAKIIQGIISGIYSLILIKALYSKAITCSYLLDTITQNTGWFGKLEYSAKTFLYIIVVLTILCFLLNILQENRKN